MDRFRGDNMNANKTWKYWTEFEVLVESIDDLEVIKSDFYGNYMRFMNIPDLSVGEGEVLTRIDFETLDEISDFADLAYDKNYIDDEVYQNIEEYIEEYE